MFCKQCQYNLDRSIDCCPECGRPFNADESSSWSPYSMPQWKVSLLKWIAIIDRWWFYAVATILLGLCAVFVEGTRNRIQAALLALLELAMLITTLRHGPISRRKLAEAMKPTGT